MSNHESLQLSQGAGHHHLLEVFLQRSGGRLTAPRRRILEEVYQVDGHFSGDDIFIRLRNTGSDISRASIFRTLPLLVRAGLLRESLTTERHKHYEHTWGHSHHEHLVCTRCGEVREFDNPRLEQLLRQIGEAAGYRIRDHKIEIFGLCEECRTISGRREMTVNGTTPVGVVTKENG